MFTKQFLVKCGATYTDAFKRFEKGGCHIGMIGGDCYQTAVRLASTMPLNKNNVPDEIKSIYFSAGLKPKFTYFRPIRYPHYTSSYAGLFGGGKSPIPGEVSLAHGGLLILNQRPFAGLFQHLYNRI